MFPQILYLESTTLSHTEHKSQIAYILQPSQTTKQPDS